MFGDIPLSWLFITKVAILAIVVALAIWVLWWVWWQLPKRHADSYRPQIRDVKDRADIEDNFRKHISQIYAGSVVALIAGTFTLLQAQLAFEANKIQQNASKATIAAQQLARGFEQLSSTNVISRVAGIYTLEGVENTGYSNVVIDTMSAFIREATGDREATKPPAFDVQVALTVIGRRSSAADRVQLYGAHIPYANLNAANLSYANLSKADLREANLSHANLRGADLSNSDLSRSLLSAADLSQANLREADLREAYLSHANLRGADLSNSNLSRSLLSAADLSQANLREAVLNLANLREAGLREANLSQANLRGADLSRANLNGADLTDAKISESQLNEACGDDKTKLPPGLTIKPCPPEAKK